jgi:signal transduction histidine kinase/CheY-like chemotaxis protein
MKSLARKFLLGVGAMSIGVTAVASAAAFAAFQHELVEQQVASMGDYVRERSELEGRRFTDLSRLHASADRALRARMASLSDAEAERLFDHWFPLQPDGTRRSAADSFDGRRDSGADLSFGMGAFVADGAHVDLTEKKALVAAYSVISHFGEAVHGSYDNFFFFTPTDRMVVFGPDRADRLEFYRHKAPATFSFRATEMAGNTRPANNPARAMRCTKLENLMSDPRGERVGTGCTTPFDIGGRHVGAFGNSIQVSDYLMRAVHQTLPGASNVILSDKGELIAYPGFSKPGVASAETSARLKRALKLDDVLARVHAERRSSGVVTVGGDIVAYGRLAGPDWWFLISYPRTALMWSAARSAAWILVIGAVAAVLQSLLVVYLARRAIVKPLQRLAQSTGWKGRRRVRVPIADIEARPDEIGALARALRSEREKVGAVLESLEERVRRRTAELESANREKSRFLANMSHELRTPLNGVVAVSEVLAKAQKTRKNRELAELVASSGRLLEQVLTDILDFSKIEAGQMSVDPTDFDLETVVGRVAELHRAVAEAKGLEFAWRVARPARGAWRGDPVRLTQILSNLLSNAVKFTSEGRVVLTADLVDGALRFRVTDTGVGFDESVRARLFKRFQQADASVTRRFGGTGLGLSISGSLAELMGGRIEAMSEPGKGSTFELTLPLPRAETAPAAPEAAFEASVLPEGLRILLAEDHPTNQKVARLILEAAGADLTVVENGREAVEAVAAGAFDLVLMDMQMPEMDGLTATRRIRDLELTQGRRRLPIVMLTANALDEHVQASLQAGADRHVSKPLRPDELLGAIAEVLDAAAAAIPEADAA